MRKKKNMSGFSLVELMVVVAIIGILATLALPRLKVFQAKARQAEARTNLKQIFTLEEAYAGDNDEYVNLSPIPSSLEDDKPECKNNSLGFIVTPCSKARYQYEVTDASTSSYLGSAKSSKGDKNKVMSGCDADKWGLNESGVISASKEDFDDVNDVTKTCDSK